MKEGTLLKDAGIVLLMFALGVLVYLVFPVTNSKINLTTTTTNAMPTESQQLKVEVLKEGSGPSAQKGQSIDVDYTGKLMDGTVFDSSIPRGKVFTLTLGAGQVISGWEMGLLGMKVGEKRRLTIPPELAYGASGIGGVIPPQATLIFDVEMMSIK